MCSTNAYFTSHKSHSSVLKALSVLFAHWYTIVMERKWCNGSMLANASMR